MSTVQKIAALLTMAERTSNEHEADAFLQKAQELATKASVDIAMARAATAKAEKREQPISRTIAIGELGKHANKNLVELFLAIAHENDLRCDIASNSTYVIAFGMPSDIDVVEALHNSLSTQMVTAATNYLRLGAWKQETYYKQAWRKGYKVPVKVPHTQQSARKAFYVGFVDRIAERLKQARLNVLFEQRDLKVQTSTGEILSAEVVLFDKEQEVGAFYRGRSNASGKSWQGVTGSRRTAVSGAGRAAADRAQIGKAAPLGRSGEISR